LLRARSRADFDARQSVLRILTAPLPALGVPVPVTLERPRRWSSKVASRSAGPFSCVGVSSGRP